MKKFFSLVLALVMALSLTTVAWGAPFDLQAAIDSAQDGDIITVTGPVNASAIITIDKPLTIEGGDNILTSSAARAINIDTTGTVEIKNLTVNASGERAFNVINQPATLKLTNVTATAANYTVNVAGSAIAANVTITDSDLTGLNTVNVAAPDAVVAITGGTIVCNDPNSNPAPAGETYGALFLNSNATGAKITASGVTFDIKHDSSIAVNAATDGTITIDNNAGAVDVMVAEIKYGDYAYVFPTVQDAIDHAVNVDGATEAHPVEIVVLDAAINSGESFPETEGVELTLPAGAELVDDGTGNVVVAPAGTSGGAVATKFYVADGNATNGWKLVSSFPGAEMSDFAMGADDNFLPCYEIPGYGFFAETNAASGAFKLVYGAKTVYLNPVDYIKVHYDAKASVFTNITKETDECGKLVVTDTTKAYYVFYDELDDDEDYYFVATKNGSIQLLIGGKIVDVELHTAQALTAHKWVGYDVVNNAYTTIKCENCEKVAKLYANKTAAGKNAVYVDDYGWITATSAALPSAVVPSAPSTDKVTSAETFDAGIAMYVGMSVMAATGAVVLKKREG